MNRERAIELAQRLLDSWNTQEVERVVDCYTDDVRYRDPNTRGFVEGSDALRRYLTRLFERWQMHWALREAYPFHGAEGAAVLWRATLRPRGGDDEVQIDGMDLALVEGNRLSRNDVYFDRAALAPLVSTTAWAECRITSCRNARSARLAAAWPA